MTSRPLGYEQRLSLESATATFQAGLVDSPQAVGYLGGRGISRDTAARFRLGFVREALDGFERFVDWISIPYICGAGHVVGIKFRSLYDEGQRYDAPSNQRTRLFNPAALLSTGDTLCVTEGEFDTMILSQIGLQSVGVPGTNTWKAHHWRLLEGFRRVVLFRDNDEAGAILENELKNANLPVVVVHPRGGKDVTVSYMAGHGDELIGLALGIAPAATTAN